VGALAHYLEDEGVATTQISLVREHTAAIRPPRALWVPFILGRPFGVPNDAAFQRRVVHAALRLLEADSGPVLEDFDEDAPGCQPGAQDAYACPVSFGAATAGDDATALQKEIEELMPWNDLALQRRERASAPTSGLDIRQAGKFVTDFIADPGVASYCSEFSRGLALRLACEDVKAFYLDSVYAQPGEIAAQQAHAWFWLDTTAGRVLRKLREVCLASDDRTIQTFAGNNLVPRAILHTAGGKRP
jgi:hypothetical protein